MDEFDYVRMARAFLFRNPQSRQTQFGHETITHTSTLSDKECRALAKYAQSALPHQLAPDDARAIAMERNLRKHCQPYAQGAGTVGQVGQVGQAVEMPTAPTASVAAIAASKKRPVGSSGFQATPQQLEVKRPRPTPVDDRNDDDDDDDDEVDFLGQMFQPAARRGMGGMWQAPPASTRAPAGAAAGALPPRVGPTQQQQRQQQQRQGIGGLHTVESHMEAARQFDMATIAGMGGGGDAAKFRGGATGTTIGGFGGAGGIGGYGRDIAGAAAAAAAAAVAAGGAGKAAARPRPQGFTGTGYVLDAGSGPVSQQQQQQQQQRHPPATAAAATARTSRNDTRCEELRPQTYVKPTDASGRGKRACSSANIQPRTRKVFDTELADRTVETFHQELLAYMNPETRIPAQVANEIFASAAADAADDDHNILFHLMVLGQINNYWRGAGVAYQNLDAYTLAQVLSCTFDHVNAAYNLNYADLFKNKETIQRFMRNFAVLQNVRGVNLCVLDHEALAAFMGIVLKNNQSEDLQRAYVRYLQGWRARQSRG